MKRRKKRKLKNKVFRALFTTGIITLISFGFIQNQLARQLVVAQNVENDFKMDHILANEALYPSELVELALTKPETRAFVYNYLEKKDLPQKDLRLKNHTKGAFPLFIQWDERWGYDQYGDNYMAINGCGPTTLAMAIVGLTGNTDVNPKMVANFSVQNGYYVNNVGTSWALMSEGAQAFGLNSKEVPLSESKILSLLREGQPIIASMGPGTFTTSGHFILLTGITEDNKIIINDSDSKVRSEMTWDIDVFMNETKNLWTFYI